MRRAAPAGLSAVLALTSALSGCAAKRVGQSPDPSSARRFEILSVSDTTFRFLAVRARWLHPGQTGIAVDPHRHDVLVARYVVQARVGDTVTALITGQAADVTNTHVALLNAPRTGALRQRPFWLGFLAGGVLSASAALVTR